MARSRGKSQNLRRGEYQATKGGIEMHQQSNTKLWLMRLCLGWTILLLSASPTFAQVTGSPSMWLNCSSHQVIYDGNAQTGGAPPSDSKRYRCRTPVLVQGNSGNLVRTGYTLTGWNTKADGTGTNYNPGTDNFNMGSSDLTLYAKWSASCGDTAANNCYTGTNAVAMQSVGSVTTPLGKSLVYTNGIWVESGSGTRVLAADGTDNWTKALNADGRTYHNSNFIAKADVVGRVCPTHVFVPGNLVATGSCLYYDGGNAGQTLDELREWTTATSGNNAGSSWYEGNVLACAAKGMRLPTLYETSASAPSSSKPTDASPTFSSAGSGVPAVGGSYTWTASAATLAVDRYWLWSGSATTSVAFYGCNGVSCGLLYPVRCVSP